MSFCEASHTRLRGDKALQWMGDPGLQQVFSVCRMYVNTACTARGALILFFLPRKIDLG